MKLLLESFTDYSGERLYIYHVGVEYGKRGQVVGLCLTSPLAVSRVLPSLHYQLKRHHTLKRISAFMDSARCWANGSGYLV